jgi:hypothetical protein
MLTPGRPFSSPDRHRLAVRLSVMAVLACLFFPALCAADSANDQYTEPLPEATDPNGQQPSGGGDDQQPSPADPQDNTSPGNGAEPEPANPQPPAGAESPTGEDEDAEDSGDSASSAPASPGSGDGGRGNDGGGASGEPVAGGHAATGSEAAGASDDGGSPLPLLLVGLMVLAGISVAALLFRARRSDLSTG